MCFLKQIEILVNYSLVKSKNFSCNFETKGACGWTSSPLGSKHWSIGMGRTPSYDTGPTSDNTFKNRTGKYIFLESSYVQNTKPMKRGDRIIFQSPLMLASQACLRFAYHMHGRTMGALEVLVRNGKYSRRMWYKKGEQGTSWKKAEIDLTINIEYNVRFCSFKILSLNFVTVCKAIYIL